MIKLKRFERFMQAAVSERCDIEGCEGEIVSYCLTCENKKLCQNHENLEPRDHHSMLYASPSKLLGMVYDCAWLVSEIEVESKFLFTQGLDEDGLVRYSDATRKLCKKQKK